MRVLMVHNEYMVRGGEDDSTAAEEELLRQHHIELETYHVCNSQIPQRNRLRVAFDAIWSPTAYDDIRRQVRRFRPQIVHVQNFFPLLSPSVYYAAHREGASVVQTLRNYRLTCANGLFFRSGRICEDCLGRFVPWPAIVHRCYRESAAASATVGSMVAVHRALQTWSNQVDVYVALTNFAKQKFILAGLPVEKVAIKPNFVFTKDVASFRRERRAFVYAGRLSAEKGLGMLLQAWKQTNVPAHLFVAGAGPLAAQLESIPANERVSCLGRRTPEDTATLIEEAIALILPSLVYEGMPRTILQAFAAGTPAIVPRLGGMAEIVENGRTGLLFTPGNTRELATKIEWAWGHPNDMREMGQNARREYEEKYSAEENYKLLMGIYHRAVANRC